MKHQCSNCFGEFVDDAPSSNPPERVFCVFCGVALAPPTSPGSAAVPFSAEHQREEDFALGVIGGTTSAFPDTLRQFRAHGAPGGMDSFAPVNTEPDPASPAPAAVPWKLGRFWTSLAVGFAVGACAAVLFAGRAAPRPAAVASAPVPPVQVAAPTMALSGCAAAPATPVVAASPPTATKPVVTPLLEKRFWLERARGAQRQYHLADAERFYRRALSQAPRDSEALAGLGELELLRGERALADQRFREALEANENYVPARVALADLHWQSGQSEAARRAYRDIVEQYSSDAFPPYVIQRLEGDACVPECARPMPVPAPQRLLP
jgi:hypothetical protein